MSKLGLILKGGGMRGVYAVGVLDFPMEQNLYTDGVIGVSVGTCHVCSYVSRQIGRAYHTNTAYLEDRCYMSVFFLLKTGDFFGAKPVYEDIPNTLDPYDLDAFSTPHTKLYAVASNLEAGKVEYLQCTNMKRGVIYVRASTSLPLLPRIVKVDGKKLLNDGATGNIPIHRSQEMGYTKNIVVPTQRKEYRKGKNNLLSMIRRSYKKYPRFAEALGTRHIVCNRTLDKLVLMEKEGSIFLIRLSSLVETSRLEKNEARLRELYEQGHMDTKDSFEGLRSFIANEN